MSDDVDSALGELELAIAPLLDGRHDVEVTRARIGSSSTLCLTLTVEPSVGPCRYLRVHANDAEEPDWRYAWLWSSYRATEPRDNCDGRGLGDLARTVNVVRHWILDEMRWQDVPEFDRP